MTSTTTYAFRTWLQRCTMLIFVFFSGMPLFSAGIPHTQPESRSKKPLIVFLISKDSLNYEADLRIPPFAKLLSEKHGFRTAVLQAEGTRTQARFPGLEILKRADLVVVFARRLALPSAQLALLKDYLQQGKPLIGLRTANHAFSVNEKPLQAGYSDWWDFVPEVLGCYNRGYGPVPAGTDVSAPASAKDHPILRNVTPLPWHSTGNLYYVEMTEGKQREILLEGAAAGKKNPVAWTIKNGSSSIFYTSLGHPSDWETPQFPRLLLNAIEWTLNR